MGALSWERTAVVIVGPAGGGVGARIEQARVTFRIEKSTRSSANTATVTVYNLGEANRRCLQTKGSIVKLSAGYGDVQELLFLGEVTTGSAKWEPPEWISEAECRDGQSALRSSLLSRTWPVGTARIIVVQALVAAMDGVAVGAIETGPLAGVLSSPLSVSGAVRPSLDRLATAWGFSWSIQDGAVEIREPGKFGRGWQVAPLLSPTTGLIGSPEWTDDGLEVRALLTPRLRPGGAVRVSSRAVSGTFLVQTVAHEGDTHGDQWTTSAVCVGGE